jgi:hypothetical protein
MARTQFSVDNIRAEAVKPLYAVAGAAEVGFQLARGYATEAQQTAQERLADAQKRVAKLERDPKALQQQARGVVNARIDELQKDAKKAQARFEARVEELQKQAKAFPNRVQSELEDALEDLVRTYAELSDRGEKLIAAIRKDGVKALSAISDAPARSSVKRREDALKGARNRKPATASSTASKTAKSPAKKAPANKSTAKATQKAPSTKKAPARKTTTAKKSTSTSSTTSSSTSA